MPLTSSNLRLQVLILDFILTRIYLNQKIFREDCLNPFSNLTISIYIYIHIYIYICIYICLYISLVARSGRPKALHDIYIIANVYVFFVKHLVAIER